MGKKEERREEWKNKGGTEEGGKEWQITCTTQNSPEV